MVMYAFSRSGIQSRGDVQVEDVAFGESDSDGVRTQCSDCVVVDDTGKRESITSYDKRQICSRYPPPDLRCAKHH